jgi:hypothetical protein
LCQLRLILVLAGVVAIQVASLRRTIVLLSCEVSLLP